jgi:hypothetical protein
MYKKREIRLNRSSNLKKGQVTLFIILGLILVIAVGLLVLIQQEVIKFTPGEIIPAGKDKFESYVESCIKQIGEDTLFTMGMQGGYVEVPETIFRDGALHLKISPINVIPYWAYGNEIRILSLEEVKSQIDNEMEKNLAGCVLGADGNGMFDEEYIFQGKSPVKSDVQLLDKGIDFKVSWDLEVKSKNGELVTQMLEHEHKSDVRLKTAYEISKKIVEEEMSTLKFEDLTQDLIALEHPDLPLAGMEVSCKKKVWKQEKVKETLQEMLRINLGQVKVEGTEAVEFPSKMTYYQNHYWLEMGDEFAQSGIGEGMKITFRYDPSYPILFQVTPLDGGMMKSSSLGGNGLLSQTCLQNWKFTYDISYPVVVQVLDPETGYMFQSAFTVHLKRNMPSREEAVFARDPRGFGKGSSSDEEKSYCENRNFAMDVITTELVESPETGVYTERPLDDVGISFTCLKYKCEIGNSKLDFGDSGYQAGMRGLFPYCVGGILRAEKEGYLESWKRVVSGDGKSFELKMAPIRKISPGKIKVMVQDVDSEGKLSGSVESGSVEEIPEEALWMITIKSKKLNDEGKPFLESKMVQAKKGMNVEGFNELQFLAEADFTYELEANVFVGEEFYSGYKGNWTVDWDKLSSAKEIVFNTVRPSEEGEEERYQFIANLGEKSALATKPEIR